MQKQIEKRITLQPFQNISFINLTSMPIGNLQNPGIGLNVFDCMLPLRGQEKFEVKKEDVVATGSFDEKKLPSSNDVKDIKQAGFGAVEINDPNQVQKLGSVYHAMQKAIAKTSQFDYSPKKQPKEQLKVKKKRLSSKNHSFSLV